MVRVRDILSVPACYRWFGRLISPPNFMEGYIHKYVNPSEASSVLDIGCGPARILDYFPPDITYVGFDIDYRYVHNANSNYSSRGKFFCSRVSPSCLHAPNLFDRVLATGVLHHLDDSEAKQLFALAYEVLKPNGYLLTFDCAFLDGQSAIARYFISKDRGQFVRNPLQYRALVPPVFAVVQEHIEHNLLRIPYTHFIMKCYK